MNIVPKLTTIAACRVAGMDRARFNEHVATGRFECAPNTIPGRARLFDPDDMIALCLFQELMDDGLDVRKAAHIACRVAQAARENPNSPTICYLEGRLGCNLSLPVEQAPAPAELHSFKVGPGTARKMISFDIIGLRNRISESTLEEASIIGPDD